MGDLRHLNVGGEIDVDEILIREIAATLHEHQIVYIGEPEGWACGCKRLGYLGPSMILPAALDHVATEVLRTVRKTEESK